MINEYTLVLFLSLLQTYNIFLYLRTFCIERSWNRRMEVLSYGFFILSRVVLYQVLLLPAAAIVFDLIGSFLLSLNYRCTISRRFFLVTFINLIFIITHAVIALLTPAYNPSLLVTTLHQSFWVSILSELVNLLIITAYSMMIRKFPGLSIKSVLVYVPITSVFILIMVYESGSIPPIFRVIGLLLLLELNWIILYFFNQMSAYIALQIKIKELENQRESYKYELELIQQSVKQVRNMRHDIKNHILILFGLLQDNKIEEGKTYLEEFNHSLSMEGEIAKSGNIVVDSIINFKHIDMEAQQINLSLKLQIPEELAISSFILSTILGNLIDNAIDGATGRSDDRYILIEIVQKQGMLRIKIVNSFAGEIHLHDGKILSHKRGYSSPGRGLDRVQEITEKNQGIFEIHYDEKEFLVEVLLYLE